MMLTSSDLLTCRLSPEIMSAAAKVALKGLALAPLTRVQDEVAFAAQRIVDYSAYLTLRCCLYEKGVPHSAYLPAPFSDPDQQNLVIGGRRIILQIELIHKKEEIRIQRRFPETILEKEARISYSAEHFWEEDLLVFACMSGLLARSSSEINRAFQARQPVCMLHILPLKKRSPRPWSPLGTLSLKTDARRTLTFELGGQCKDKIFCIEKVSIPPGEAVRMETGFYSLTYIKAEEPVYERLALRHRLFEHAYIIHPHQWHNIWVYGLELSLAGYMSWSEYRRKAVPLSEGDGSEPAYHGENALLCLPVYELHPLGYLFEQTVKRDQEQRGCPPGQVDHH
jgi:hypothetical protein